MIRNKTNVALALIALLVNLAYSVHSVAGMKEAYSALSSGNVNSATSEIKLLAENGDPEAQYFLGAMLSEGKYVAQNHHDAFYWFNKSAEQNHPVAQYNVAIHYANGLGIEKSLEKSIDWYKKSAMNGFAYAQRTLAEKYITGQGVTKSNEDAAFWLKKAADQGDPNAQYSLAQFFYHGVIEQNYQMAFNWYQKSANQGFTDAEFALAHMYYDGKGSPVNLEKAYLYWLLASQKGHADAKKNSEIAYQRLPLTTSMRIQREVANIKINH